MCYLKSKTLSLSCKVHKYGRSGYELNALSDCYFKFCSIVCVWSFFEKNSNALPSFVFVLFLWECKNQCAISDGFWTVESNNFRCLIWQNLPNKNERKYSMFLNCALTDQKFQNFPSFFFGRFEEKIMQSLSVST